MQPGPLTRRALAGLAWVLVLAPVSASEVVEVIILDYKFSPAQLSIKAGTTVRWVNREKRTTHSVLFSGAGGFESDRFFPGETWQRKFDTPGSYPYGCGPHPEMKGQIDVTP